MGGGGWEDGRGQQHTCKQDIETRDLLFKLAPERFHDIDGKEDVIPVLSTCKVHQARTQKAEREV